MTSRAAAHGTTLAWTAVPDPTRRRAVSRELLRLVLPRGAVLSQVCGACGGDHGPVRVRLDGAPDPLVSVSYAGSIAVVGLAPVGAASFGIDVEADDDATRRAVREATDADGVAHWTRREAIAKAMGTGLRAEPERVLVHPLLTDRWISPRPGLHGFDDAIEHDGTNLVVSVALG